GEQGATNGLFSNYWREPDDEPQVGVTINGTRWPTAEHAFQAEKFNPDKAFVDGSVDHKNEARTRMLTASADEARQFGMGRNLDGLHLTFTPQNRANWGRARVEVMYNTVFAKFTQNEELARALRSTDGCDLVEFMPPERRVPDVFWGAVEKKDGSTRGLNMLGRILMQVRNDIGAGRNSIDPAALATLQALAGDIGDIRDPNSASHKKACETVWT
ncbi:MAG TPA: NADAR family protein, partial [Burkholderiaceae bacterium]|nr:NADAR family protein [Burkholderiaceae bacterium]